MGHLLLVRHGESRWNLSNKFTGWVDVPLSDRGVHEALLIAINVKKFPLDVAFTSHLTRAQETLLIILSDQDRTGIFVHDEEPKMRYRDGLDRHEIPVYTTLDLNERNYGDLEGMNKASAKKKYGMERVLFWRRSYEGRPPGGESLKDVYHRVVPYFKRKVWPELKKDKNVMVVAHGNTLRAIIKYLENISDDNIADLELEPGQPITYNYSKGKLKRVLSGLSFDRPILWKK